MKQRSVYNLVCIKADRHENEKLKTEILDLIIDTSFNPMDENHVVQSGVVHSLPMAIDGGEDIDLEIGDKVYCHHFMSQYADFRDEYHELRYQDIYCKVVDGEISMLKGWVLLEPLEFDKNQAGISIERKEINDTRKAVLSHICPELIKAKEVCPKDVVYFRKDCDYPIIVEGKLYFRVRTKDLLAYECI